MIEPGMTGAFERHTLKRTYGDPGSRYQGFRMGREGSEVYSVYLHFSPRGIFFQGDWSPPGVPQSGFGCKEAKSLGWFLGDLSEDYLAGKFFDEEFVAAAAAAEIRDRIENAEDYGLEPMDVESLGGIVSGLLAGHYGDSIALQDVLQCESPRIVRLFDDGMPGWTVNPAASGWLQAMRLRFVALYALLERGESEGRRLPLTVGP